MRVEWLVPPQRPHAASARAPIWLRFVTTAISRGSAGCKLSAKGKLRSACQSRHWGMALHSSSAEGRVSLERNQEGLPVRYSCRQARDTIASCYRLQLRGFSLRSIAAPCVGYFFFCGMDSAALVSALSASPTRFKNATNRGCSRSSRGAVGRLRIVAMWNS